MFLTPPFGIAVGLNTKLHRTLRTIQHVYLYVHNFQWNSSHLICSVNFLDHPVVIC